MRTDLRICSESTNLNFASRDSSVWVDNDGKERIEIHLICGLSCYVNAGEPATITWVGVVPPYDIFWAPNLA